MTRKLTQREIIAVICENTAKHLAYDPKYSSETVYFDTANRATLEAMVKNGSLVEDRHANKTLSPSLLEKHSSTIRAMACEIVQGDLERAHERLNELQTHKALWRAFLTRGTNKARVVCGDYSPQVSENNTWYSFSYSFTLADYMGETKVRSVRPWLEDDSRWIITYSQDVQECYQSLARCEIARLPVLSAYAPSPERRNYSYTCFGRR